MSAQENPITPLIGHQQVQGYIQEAFENNRLQHSLLLHGPAGIGKSKLAIFTAAWLLSKNQNTIEMFDAPASAYSIAGIDQENPEARLVFSGAHPDFLFVSSKGGEDNKSGQIKAEELRKIKSFLSQTPARGDWRVVIVDSLDAINVTGANAMLKTLEEPPEKSLIILLASNIATVLPTILSRCTLFKAEPLMPNETRQVMERIWPDGDAHIINQLALLSGGAPGRAEMLQHAGALGLFEQSCLMIAHPQFSMRECRAVADKWGAGGASQSVRRQSATFLFGELLSAAAICAAHHDPNDGKTDFTTLGYVHDAVMALVERHSARMLAEYHQAFISNMRKAEHLYLDASSLFVRFFQDLHRQKPMK